MGDNLCYTLLDYNLLNKSIKLFIQLFYINKFNYLNNYYFKYFLNIIF